MNSPAVLLPLVTVAFNGESLTPDQRIAIDGTRSPSERAEALLLAIGPELGRYLAGRHPLGTVDIAEVVSALWIKVLGHIGTFQDQEDTEVASWHQVHGWVHAIAVSEASDRADLMKRRNAARLAPVEGIRTGSPGTVEEGRS